LFELLHADATNRITMTTGTRRIEVGTVHSTAR
jgi:hypothetical protein